ncbi:MAG: ABC transporter permease [Actinobacteria bacterium]|nr:ABC transporter permease [Actinomycetota bacterium]MCI0678347.1 ABC transporter permease [Actinomycetota bacterium]
MNALVGTTRLARLVLRRDRFRLTVWVAVLALLPVATASALASLFPTVADRESLAVTVASSPALVAFLGPLYDTSVGALTLWRVGTLAATLAGLMAVLTVVRHTRDEEETGRRELLGATVLGRSAPLAAAMIVVTGAGVVIGAVAAAGLMSIGETAAGSVAYGLGTVGVVMAFAAIGAWSAQLTESATSARGIAVGVVAGVWLLRVAGDGGEAAGLGFLSWLSPVGWFARLRPFADEQWWVLLLWVGLTLVVGAVSFAVMARRDIGAGVLRPRPGPARGSLGSPVGLAWRLHRGSALGWTLGLMMIGVVFGAVADAVGEMLSDSPQLAAFFEAIGGAEGVTDAYFSASVGLIALVAAAYSIRTVLRLRVEEESLRAEPILATGTTRTGWVASHLLFGVAVPAVMLLLAGVVSGVVFGLVTDDVATQATRVLGAAVIQLPAVWVMTGVALALFGVAPALVGVSWGLLVAFLLIAQLGEILQFPQWVMNLSPFTHIPLIPVEDLEILPLALLLALALILVATGLVGVRSRDIPS